MATFKDLTDEQLMSLGDRLIRNVKARVDRQVPSPGRNPFSKGQLQQSLSYSWDKLDDGKWGLKISMLDHGNFVNFGTRAYYNPMMKERSIFGYDFRGYEKAKGGIRPQGFLSLRGDQPVYEAIIEAEVRVTFEEFVNNTMSPFTNKQQT